VCKSQGSINKQCAHSVHKPASATFTPGYRQCFTHRSRPRALRAASASGHASSRSGRAPAASCAGKRRQRGAWELHHRGALGLLGLPCASMNTPRFRDIPTRFAAATDSPLAQGGNVHQRPAAHGLPRHARGVVEAPAAAAAGRVAATHSGQQGQLGSPHCVTTERTGSRRARTFQRARPPSSAGTRNPSLFGERARERGKWRALTSVRIEAPADDKARVQHSFQSHFSTSQSRAAASRSAWCRRGRTSQDRPLAQVRQEEARLRPKRVHGERSRS
jgi:hypothetical protein